jgi:multidrug transporter EmrE-like cation transporter
MVPGDFVNFFTTMAAVGATLFGLIFVVISIRPEVTRAETTTVMRQVQAASSYTALLNPLVISLLALLPHATIDTITLIMSGIGLVNTLIMGIFLLRDSRGWLKKWNSVFFLLAGLVMYGFELFYAILLARTPKDSFTLYNLASLLVLIYLYGIARAWDLVGAR